MMIRKFTGSSFKDALDQVKQELGAHAMILSSRSIKSGGFGLFQRPMVEVTAAGGRTDTEGETAHFVGRTGILSCAKSVRCARRWVS